MQATTVHKAGAVGLDELIVSQSVDPDDLRVLLESLVGEDCAHSWKNFGRGGTLDELLRWENERRPTELFFFYVERDGARFLVAASAVAATLTRDFPHLGFCVLGRCYIMPKFRSQGLYREILRYRLERCREQLGDALNAVHIGASDERIAHVITHHGFAGWPKFTHLGEESLSVAGQVKTVGAYMMLLPAYAGKIRSALDGPGAPACVAALHDALVRIESEDVRDLGTHLKDTFEAASACGWFDDRDPHEIEQLLSFCSAIPLVGFS